MPLYEYQCEACGHRFEVIQKFSDAPIASCPTCAGPVQKLLSSPAIQFKGSGFYLTDYGRGTGKKETGKASKDGAETPSSKADGTSGGESKAASSSDAGSGSSAGDTAAEKKPAPAAKSD